MIERFDDRCAMVKLHDGVLASLWRDRFHNFFRFFKLHEDATGEAPQDLHIFHHLYHPLFDFNDKWLVLVLYPMIEVYSLPSCELKCRFEMRAQKCLLIDNQIILTHGDKIR